MDYFAKLFFFFQAKQTNDDEEAKFHNPCAKRSDTGKYKVKISNDNGEDEGEISVIVLGKSHFHCENIRLEK